MKRLLIDIGNTRIKGCIANGIRLGKIVSKSYEKKNIVKDYSCFLSQFKPKVKTTKSGTSFKTINISLPNRSLYAKILFISGEYITNFINSECALPIKIDYSDTLGSDRICSAVGAYMKFKDKNNLLIIDLGTATTFNILSKGVYKGGMISPGIKTSADALLNRTSLPKVFLSADTSLICKDTEKAIVSGIVFQQVMFIQKAVEEYKKLFKGLYVLATGGGLEIIKQYKTGIDKFEPNLVLEGLNFIAEYNETVRKK